jgi:glycosyltransferase involved in cell wall biosynthesis
VISFIMPARNVSSYVREAIDTLRKANYEDWELIVIDDHSTDDTINILKEIEAEDPRIQVFQNDGHGKVHALNYGYQFTNGDFIKCIDADDVLAPTFFDFLHDMTRYEASCHDYYIAKSDLRVIGEYSMNKAFFRKSFDDCLKNLISLPRCIWLFKRHIGNMIFPMPDNLPFEDVWFSLIIKKYAGPNIYHVPQPLYYYRQHKNQTFGGVLNFNKQIVIFRANRMLKFIEAIEQDPTKRLTSGIKDPDFFEDITSFYLLLAQERLRLQDIIRQVIPRELKLKLLIYRKLSFLTMSLLKLKWLLDRTW